MKNVRTEYDVDAAAQKNPESRAAAVRLLNGYTRECSMRY